MTARPTPSLTELLGTAGIGCVGLRRSDQGLTAIEANRLARDWLGLGDAGQIGSMLERLAAANLPLEIWAELVLAVGRDQPFAAELPAIEGRAALALVGAPTAGDTYWLVLQPLPAAASATAASPRPVHGGLDALLDEPIYALEMDVDCRLSLAWTMGPMAELLGRQPTPGSGWTDWVHPEDRVRWRDRNLAVLAGRPARCSYRLQGAGGVLVAVDDDALPEQDASGQVRGLVARLRRRPDAAPAPSPAETVAVPTDDLVRVVRHAGARFAALIEPDGSLATVLLPAADDAEGEAWPTASGLAALLQEQQAALAGCLRAADPDSADLALRLDGVVVDLVRLQNDRALALVGSAPPPAKPPGLEELAPPAPSPRRVDDSRWRAVLDVVVDGVVTANAKGLIEDFSPSAERLFRTPASAARGRPLEAFVGVPPGEEADLLALLQNAHGNGGRLTELVARRGAEDAVPIEVTVSQLDDRDPPGFLLTARDVSARREAEETIRRLASRDPLTGLPNRLLFDDRLAQTVERARRNPQEFAVMLLDLDRFKLVNESLGMAKGDQLLREVARRLVLVLRRADTVARLGGDEFLLLLPGCRGAENAAKVAQKILDVMRQPYAINGQELSATASIGIALFPHDGGDGETLVKNADTALYRTKEQGRNSYQFYTGDMNARAFERLVLETQLRRALERGELALHYQPFVSVATGEITGVEALVRWFHPELGRVPPGEFIPLAEETGLILPIGQWVLTEACRQAREWQRSGFEGLRLAVNLSGRQFKQRNLVDIIRRVLHATGMPASLLELELTESALMEDVGESVGRLQAIHDLGVQFAVDDFGTGYSSLAYLKRFPIRCLKIDRSFVKDVTTDPNDAAIAQAIVALAEMLKISIVAEGVETREQLAMMKRFRCDELQGFLFSGPLPPDELLALLRSGRTLDVTDLPEV